MIPLIRTLGRRAITQVDHMFESICLTEASECEVEVTQKIAPWRTLDDSADKNAREESDYTG